MIDTFDGERVDPSSLDTERLHELRAKTVAYVATGEMRHADGVDQIVLIDEVIDSRNDDLWRPDGTEWQFDLHLHDDSPVWLLGVYTEVVRIALGKLLDNDGQVVEVTDDDGTVWTGVIGEWDEDSFTVTEDGELPRVIDPADVRRFRA